MAPSQQNNKKLTIGVLVTTYKRPDWLMRCIESISGHQQTVAPDALWVVCREDDTPTRQYLESLSAEALGIGALHVKITDKAGVVHANNAALPEIDTDILCFLDDDAEAPADWLARIQKEFASRPKLGALGGRDILSNCEARPAQRAIGQMTFWGQIIGNHHLPVHDKKPRPVDFLKGVNMSFRRNLLPTLLDNRFRGNCCFYESDICLTVKEKGYQLHYDPTLTVAHDMSAPHFHDANTARNEVNEQRLNAYLFNRMLVLGKHFKGVTGLRYLLTNLLLWLPWHTVKSAGLISAILRTPQTMKIMFSGWNAGKTPVPLAYRYRPRQHFKQHNIQLSNTTP